MTVVYSQLVKPGLHVLIAGVSAYSQLPKRKKEEGPPTFGLLQLTSTALSAYKIYRWVIEHKDQFPVPLASCRVLLSPTERELNVEPGMKNLTALCTLDNFRKAAIDWREDASSSADNMTLFYFAGHGTQRTKDDSVLLMEDFGDKYGGGFLAKAVDLNNIFKGMAASQTHPQIARTQIYFVDACRDIFTALQGYEKEKTSQVFSVELNEKDFRYAPIYFAAIPGSQAYEIDKDQTLFSKALLDCMENDAGELEEFDGVEKWHISVQSLIKVLQQKAEEWRTDLRAEQYFMPGGYPLDTVICYLKKRPTVKVTLKIIPQDANPITQIDVLNDEGDKLKGIPVPLNPHPYECVWPAGSYTIHAKLTAPDPRYTSRKGKSRPIMPPRYEWKRRVTHE